MITSLYSGILGLIFFKISIDTIKARGKEKVSLGVGANNEIVHIVSAHSNFSSYTPLFLIQFYLLETMKLNVYLLHTAALAFTTGRVIHYLTMRDKERTFKKRKLGMQLTLFPIILVSSANIILFLMKASN